MTAYKETDDNAISEKRPLLALAISSYSISA